MPFESGNGGCTAYGIYKDVIPHHTLSWDDFCDDENGNFFHKAFVTVAFEDLGGDKTRVTLRARLDPPAKRDPKFTIAFMEQGWTEGWKDNLEVLVHYLPQSHARDRQIEVSRDYDAPRALVWEAFTDSKHVDKWWGPNGFRTTTESREVKAGGAWRFVMRGPDGRDWPNHITYLEVTKPDRLVYAHGSDASAADFHTTVTFEALGPRKTRLTLRVVFMSAEARRVAVEEFGAIEGGKQTLGRLAEQLKEME
jgi:uncharacterized protein YndB with AHSA1/START domain